MAAYPCHRLLFGNPQEGSTNTCNNVAEPQNIMLSERNQTHIV